MMEATMASTTSTKSTTGSERLLTETQTRYLDADGDGLLDAVEVIERIVSVGDGSRRVLDSSRMLFWDIGDDGVPHRVVLS
jgi:hypothetical protein